MNLMLAPSLEALVTFASKKGVSVGFIPPIVCYDELNTKFKKEDLENQMKRWNLRSRFVVGDTLLYKQMVHYVGR